MDRFEQLKALKKLMDDGIISEEEFNTKKAQILGSDETGSQRQATADPEPSQTQNAVPESPQTQTADTAAAADISSGVQEKSRKKGIIMGAAGAVLLIIVIAVIILIAGQDKVYDGESFRVTPDEYISILTEKMTELSDPQTSDKYGLDIDEHIYTSKVDTTSDSLTYDIMADGEDKPVMAISFGGPEGADIDGKSSDYDSIMMMTELGNNDVSSTAAAMIVMMSMMRPDDEISDIGSTLEGLVDPEDPDVDMGESSEMFSNDETIDGVDYSFINLGLDWFVMTIEI